MTSRKCSFEETAVIARKAIPFMSENQIAVNPRNYHIWYEYFQSTRKDLKDELDSLLDAGKPMDERTMEKIYEKFFHHSYEDDEREKKIEEEIKVINRVNRDTERMLRPLRTGLSELSGKTEDYSARLEQYANKILGVSQQEAGSVLKAISSDTKDAAISNRSASERMTVYAKRIEELNYNLTRARKEARIDDLTHIANRRAFNESLEREVKWATKVGKVSTLIMIDIDFFKKINDLHGHQVGDRALSGVAGILDRRSTQDITVFRYGGEEFAIILHDSALDKAIEVAERSRNEVGGATFEVGKAEIRITISLGVSEIKGGRSLDNSSRMADEALYLAKESGRNNVKSELEIIKAGC